MTISDDVHSMSDHDLLIRVAVKSDTTEQHLAKLNNSVAAIKGDQYIMKGAIGMLAFLFIASISVAGVIAAFTM